MALSLTLDGKIVELNNISFEDDISAFKLMNSSVEIFIDYIPSIHTDFIKDEYSVYIFKNDILNSENDIFQVFLNNPDKRIGWIFPIQALLSNQHQHARSVPFLNYSFVAFYQLLLNKNFDYVARPELRANASMKLTDFYPENSIVFVLSHATIKDDIKSFNIENLILPLFQFNYYVLSDKNLKAVSQKKFKHDYYSAIKGKSKLYIDYCSDNLVADFYIINLFKTVLPVETHHLVRFHNVYQVIEILIEEIFDLDFDNAINQFNKGEITRMDFKVRLGKILDETKRINDVINYSKIGDNQSEDLKNACNDILSKVQIQLKNSLTDAIYKVRSLIVHDYRKFRDNNDLVELLEIVIFYYEIFVADLLMLYFRRKDVESTVI